MISELMSLLILVVLLNLKSVAAQITQSSYTESDEEFHQNQIPPPGLQPSEDDVKQAIIQLVDQKIDKNGDQKLSAEELRDWLTVVHGMIIDDNVNRQWAYFGPTLQEVHSWEGYAPETKEVLSWENLKSTAYPDDYLNDDPTNTKQKLVQRSERRFTRADLNSDSVLTKEEFKGFIQPEEVEKVQSILVDEALEDMDQDNDTFVTLDEYFKHLTTVMEDGDTADPNWKQTHESHFHEYLDRNKDGKLDRDELHEWIIPKYNKHEAESYRLLTHADEDKDGELSKDEITTHYQHFYAVLPPEFWNQFAQDEPVDKHDEL